MIQQNRIIYISKITYLLFIEESPRQLICITVNHGVLQNLTGIITEYNQFMDNENLYTTVVNPILLTIPYYPWIITVPWITQRGYPRFRMHWCSGIFFIKTNWLRRKFQECCWARYMDLDYQTTMVSGAFDRGGDYVLGNNSIPVPLPPALRTLQE